ncbi:MAG: hypothetical protein ABEK50_06860 [bacterium]
MKNLIRRYGAGWKWFSLPLIVIYFTQPVFPQEQADQLRQLLEFEDRQERNLKDEEDSEQAFLEEAGDDMGRQDILRKPTEHKPFRAFSELSQRATDNAALSPFTKRSDFMSSVTTGFEYYPYEGSPKPINLRVRQQVFRYRDNSAFDFDRLTLEARGTRKRQIMDYPLYFTGRYGYEELRSGSFLGGAEHRNLIRSFHVVAGNIRFFHFLSRYETLIPKVAVEVEQTDRLNGRKGSTADNEKNNVSLSLTYYRDYSRKLNYYGSLRYRHSDYRHVETLNGLREDRNQALTVGGEWTFFSGVAINLHGFYARNESNGRSYEYRVGNLGSQFNLSYDF